jgi:hypothetical protein
MKESIITCTFCIRVVKKALLDLVFGIRPCAVVAFGGATATTNILLETA